MAAFEVSSVLHARIQRLDKLLGPSRSVDKQNQRYLFSTILPTNGEELFTIWKKET